MAIQDSINQGLGAISGAALGIKHIANQNEAQAISSFGQYETAVNQENYKAGKVAETETAIKQFDAENPTIIEDTLVATGKVKKLDEQLNTYSQQMESGKNRDEATGRFISRQQADERFANKYDELTAAKKAQSDLQVKLQSRQNMVNDLAKRKEELTLAQKNTKLAEGVKNKYEKYLPKGGNK